MGKCIETGWPSLIIIIILMIMNYYYLELLVARRMFVCFCVYWNKILIIMGVGQYVRLFVCLFVHLSRAYTHIPHPTNQKFQNTKQNSTVKPAGVEDKKQVLSKAYIDN